SRRDRACLRRRLPDRAAVGARSDRRLNSYPKGPPMTRTALIRNVLDASLPTIDHARGVWLHDTQGKDYIDGSSGAVVTLVGHTHPRVIAAIADQTGRVTYTHRGAFTNEPAEALAEDLCRLTGYPGIWLVNSGSEA